MADEIRDAIKSNATGPRRGRTDEGDFEQHPLKDQIAADRYTAQAEASKKAHRGLRFTQIVPPGGRA